MKINIFVISVILFLLTGCGDEKNATNSKEKPVNSIITSILLTQSDGKTCIKAELCCAENITLRIDTSEVMVKAGTNIRNINELKNQYSLVDAGNGIIAVVEKVPSVRREYMAFNLYKYSDELIHNVWSSNDLSAQLQNIDTGGGQFDLYVPKYDICHKLQFTKNELNHWEQKIVELRDSNIKIDDNYYMDIKDNLTISPVTYHIANINDNGDKEIMLLSDVYTVGAKTPYVRDRAVIIIKNDNGVIKMQDIIFEREATGDESPFAYFS